MKGIRRSLKNEGGSRQSPPYAGAGAYSSSNSNANTGHHILTSPNGVPYSAHSGGYASSAPSAVMGGSSSSNSIQKGMGVGAAPRPGQAGKVPPKKVIRAVSAFRSRSPQELSFEVGDFFHVVSEGYARETPDGELWFDAANPLSGARGLVPSSCFQVLGRTEREGGQPATMAPRQQQLQQHFGEQGNSSRAPMSSLRTSGGQNHLQGKSTISPVPSPSSLNFPGRAGTPTSSRGAAASSNAGNPNAKQRKLQTLYGVVQYDFRAERTDELDAKKGESIMVVAQSNHEWFVAKPIGRLGGPGLIPVSFVAISDTSTGEPLPQDKVKDMIESGMVPPVEEWKKTTAEYKQNSIPLGRFEFANASAASSATAVNTNGSNDNLPYSGRAGGAAASATSLGTTSSGGQGRPPSNPAGGKFFAPGASASSLSSQPQSISQQLDQHQFSLSNPPQRQQSYNSASGSAYGSSPPNITNGNSQMRQSGSAVSAGGYDPHLDYANGGDNSIPPAPEEDYYNRYGLVTSASVESFHSEEENYWFHLRVTFAQSGYSLILYRLYEDFFEFQYALMEEHPIEAGKALPADAPPGAMPRRIIPKMPGPVDHVDEVVCAQRVDDLTLYLRGLCALPEYLRAHPLFYEFLVPRPGDVEAVTPDESMRARWEAEKLRDRERDRELAHSAAGSRQRALDEEVVEYLDQMGAVTDGMHSTSIDRSSSDPGQVKKPDTLPPLNTSQAGSASGPFAGYSMAPNGSGSSHQRQQSNQYRPPSSQSNQDRAGYTSPGGYSDPRTSGQSNQLSAGSGINFISPFAPNQSQGASGQSNAPPPSAVSSTGGNGGAGAPPFVKIKIFHRNTDDLIAIRVPPSIRLDALLDKVRERLGGDVSHVRYRDEGHSPLSPGQNQTLLSLPGGARLVELRSDIELDEWIKTAQRLVAYVD